MVLLNTMGLVCVFGVRSEKMKKSLYSVLLFGLCSAVAAEAPLNFDTENRGKDLGATAGELKTNKKLPNPFEFHDGSKVTTPLPGVITDIKVAEGDEVKAGDTVVVLEAMKMANNLAAEKDGKVTAICVKVGESVMEDDALIVIE